MSQYSQQRGSFTIRPDYVRLDLVPIPHLGDISHVDRCAVYGLDRHIVKGRYQFRTAIQLYQILARSYLNGPSRKNKILKIERV